MVCFGVIYYKKIYILLCLELINEEMVLLFKLDFIFVLFCLDVENVIFLVVLLIDSCRLYV